MARISNSNNADSSLFFNENSWQSCEDKALTLEMFESHPCVLAFDLPCKLGMSSMARLFFKEIDGKTHCYSVAPRFWITSASLQNVDIKTAHLPGVNQRFRKQSLFKKWVEMGLLTVTDGAEVDYRYILEEAKAANKLNPVSESPIDPFGATGLSHDLADEGLNPITIVQNYTNMSDPMKELEVAIEAGRFHHDGNPIMSWCISNVVGKGNPSNGDIRPIKNKRHDEITGATALIMGISSSRRKRKISYINPLGFELYLNQTEYKSHMTGNKLRIGLGCFILNGKPISYFVRFEVDHVEEPIEQFYSVNEVARAFEFYCSIALALK